MSVPSWRTVDLPVALRDLDEKVEQTELALRAVVDTVLAGEIVDIPQHVKDKVE